MSPPLLAVQDLVLDFRTRSGRVHALDQASLTVQRGEIVGVVGESGSGKSVLAYTVMGLIDAAAEIRSGQIHFAGVDMLAATPQTLAATRGSKISMVFQSPRTALNPIRRVGQQIEDVLLRHANISRKDAHVGAIAALSRVRIPDAEHRFHAYPFELSGGMCQRVMIAMALACEPYLLIADEPTTGLDVSTQAVVMDLLRDLVDHSGTSVLLITHDLGLAGEYCDRIVVMHAGHTVEAAPAGELLSYPMHPYTERLIGATPRPGATIDSLATIPGNLPDLRRDLPPCRFLSRCARPDERCGTQPLPWETRAPGHMVRCWNPA